MKAGDQTAGIWRWISRAAKMGSIVCARASLNPRDVLKLLRPRTFVYIYINTHTYTYVYISLCCIESPTSRCEREVSRFQTGCPPQRASAICISRIFYSRAPQCALSASRRNDSPSAEFLRNFSGNARESRRDAHTCTRAHSSRVCTRTYTVTTRLPSRDSAKDVYHIY